MYKRILLLLLSLLTVPTAQAQNAFTDGQRSLLAHPNLLTNPGYEAGLAGWTKSGVSTLTQSTTAANVAYGKASASWTPANNGETLTSAQVTVPPAVYGGECAASVYVKGGSTAVTLQVVDGNPAVLATEILQAETTFKRYELRFTCPSSGTFAVRLQATGASTAVFVDQWTLGGIARQPQEYIGNQVINGAAEDNYIPSGWATYNNGVVAAPTTGTGGSATKLASPVRDTTAQIDGKASWKLSTLGSGTAEGQGWAYSFTIPTNSQLKNSLNDLTFDYYQDNTTSDLVRVYLYDVTNSLLITPQFTSCGGGANPSLASMTSGQTCHAELAWLAGTGTSYRLVFHVSDNAGAVTTAHNIWVDNLYVGQHKTSVGTQVGMYESTNAYTIGVFSGTPPTAGAGAVYYRSTYRDGDFATIRYEFAQTAAGSAGAGSYTLPLPAGLTIDTTRIAVGGVATDTAYAGEGYLQNGAGAYSAKCYVATTTTIACDVFNDTTTIGAWGSGLSALSNTVVRLGAWIRVPIAQWAGGSAFGENKCEYAYNSSTTAANDTASFAYGPVGGIPPNDATPAGAGQFWSKRVRFLTPISPTDQITTEIVRYDTADNEWYSSSTESPWVRQTAASTDFLYGISGRPVNSTDYDVYFGRGGFQPNGAGYSTAGQAWSGAGTAYRYRVKKCRAGIPTAFGQAQGNGVPGLYTPGQTAGYVNGGTIGAGYVGQILTNSGAQSGPTNTTVYTPASVTLTPGVWLVNGRCSVGYATPPSITMIKGGTSLTAAGIDDSTFTTITTYGSATAMDSGNGYSVSGIPRYLSVSASTPVYTVCTMGYTGGTSLAFNAWIQAIRIH